jgi:hypothetical protein
MSRGQTLDTDFLGYRPFFQGFSPSGMGLKKISRQEGKEREQLFQIHSGDFQQYRANKIAARANLDHYWAKLPDFPEALSSRYVLGHLLKEYPQFFTSQAQGSDTFEVHCKLTDERLLVHSESAELLEHDSSIAYTSLFDALAMQVPEDLVVHEVTPDDNRAMAVHLCHANGWSAPLAVGQSFDHIHKPVPNFQKIVPRSQQMILAFVRSEQAFERLGGLAIRTSADLDRHPRIPREERFPAFDPQRGNFFFRFERQTVSKVSPTHFLFTIRTYITALDVLLPDAEFRSLLHAEIEKGVAGDAKLADFFAAHTENLKNYLATADLEYASAIADVENHTH